MIVISNKNNPTQSTDSWITSNTAGRLIMNYNWKQLAFPVRIFIQESLDRQAVCDKGKINDYITRLDTAMTQATTCFHELA